MPAISTKDCMEQFGHWSGPALFDVLRLAYESRCAEPAAALKLARLHSQILHYAFAGQWDPRWRRERELGEALIASQLRRSAYDAANARALHELSQIVDAKFRASPRTLKAYRKALAALRERLDPLKLAA